MTDTKLPDSQLCLRIKALIPHTHALAKDRQAYIALQNLYWNVFDRRTALLKPQKEPPNALK